MPTYEYRCKHCGHEFEVFQSITSDPLKDCPSCGRNGVERLISSGAGIIFKGSGFYATDYKSGSSRSSPAGSEAGSSADQAEDTSESSG